MTFLPVVLNQAWMFPGGTFTLSAISETEIPSGPAADKTARIEVFNVPRGDRSWDADFVAFLEDFTLGGFVSLLGCPPDTADEMSFSNAANSAVNLACRSTNGRRRRRFSGVRSDSCIRAE